MSLPWISVAICTWNRSALLDLTLARMEQLVAAAGVAWELLVVDNASTDDTPNVIKKYQSRLPLISLYEVKKGHSNARNCAIEHAQGEYILWTDDDVLVNTDWLQRFAEAFEKWPSAEFFGGTVTPWFESQPPKWLEANWDRFQTFFAVRQLGEDCRSFTEFESPFGANMAFRLKTLRQYGFDPKHGHIGNIARGGDETDVFQRMRQDKLEGVWVGSAGVRHFIPNVRMNKRFLWDYARRIARQVPPPDDSSTKILGVPRWLVKEYVRCRYACLLRSWAADKQWAELFLRSASLRGRMDEYRSRA